MHNYYRVSQITRLRVLRPLGHSAWSFSRTIAKPSTHRAASPVLSKDCKLPIVERKHNVGLQFQDIRSDSKSAKQILKIGYLTFISSDLCGCEAQLLATKVCLTRLPVLTREVCFFCELTVLPDHHQCAQPVFWPFLVQICML